MYKRWRARSWFDIAATDVAMAHNIAFGVLIDACRLARQEGVGVITRPVHDLENQSVTSRS